MTSTFIYALYAFLFMSVENYDFSALLFLFPASIFSIYYAFSLSFVQGDNSFLYVKRFQKTEKIPLVFIKDISFRDWRTKEITIYLIKKSTFGKKIVFIPYSKWFLFGSEHPVVSEVKAYLKRIDSNQEI